MANGNGTGRTDYSALEERVSNQGIAIRALSDEMATSFREIRTETSRLFTDLGTQIKANSVEAATSYKSLEAKFDSNAARQADASRPQYLALFGAMIAAISISVTIIQWQTGLHDKPVDDKINTLTVLLGDLSKATVSRSEYDLTNTFNAQALAQRTATYASIKADTDARITRLGDYTKSEVDRLMSLQVPRTEHQFHWDAEAKVDAHLEDEIRALNGRLDNLAPAGDLLKTLIERQHELELQVYGRKLGAPGS